MRTTMINGEGLNYGKRKSDNNLDRIEISSLSNNAEYYLNCVYISVEKVGYRLVVIHNRVVRTNRCYSTYKSAKAAFARMYNRKAWKKNVMAKWSNWYNPGDEFVREKAGLLRTVKVF